MQAPNAHADSMQLTALNQNWLNGHSLYSAMLQGYRTGGRITALGLCNHAEMYFSNLKQLVYFLS
jgi:hypothetical protein